MTARSHRERLVPPVEERHVPRSLRENKSLLSLHPSRGGGGRTGRLGSLVAGARRAWAALAVRAA